MVICDGCGFKRTDCVLKPKVAADGGGACSLFAKSRAPKKRRTSKTTWPTAKGIMVKTVKPDGKATFRIRKK